MHVIDMPVTLATAVVTVLALIFYIWTGLSVAGARGKHSVKAPTMTGSPIGTAINLIIQIRPGKSCLRESASATGRPRTMERTVDNVA